MKLLIAAIVLMTSTLTFAGEKYICKEKKESWESKTSFILTQIGDAKITEGEKFAFQLEVFEGQAAVKIELGLCCGIGSVAVVHAFHQVNAEARQRNVVAVGSRAHGK